MRKPVRLGVGALLVASAAACDSTQPDQYLEQTASFTVRAVNARALVFNVWDYIRDNDGNQVPDDGKTYLWCEQITDVLPPATVPWTFSLEVSLIRSGSTVAERISDPASLSATANVALYDTTVVRGLTPSIPPRFSSGATPGGVVTVGGNKYQFVAGTNRRHTAVHETVMRQTSNPLAAASGLSALGAGVCTKGNPGDARIDLVPQPYSIVLNKGDTLIVKALPATAAPSGVGLEETLPQLPSAIVATLKIDGRDVNAVGTTSGAALSFSYTSR